MGRWSSKYGSVSRNRLVKRQWLMMKLIAASRYMTLSKLSAETGVCVKTVRRDIDALREVGFPLYFVRPDRDGDSDGPCNFIRLDKNWLDLNGVKQPAPEGHYSAGARV